MGIEDRTEILFGICQWSMPELEPGAATQILSELGLDGIELDAGNWDGTHLTLSNHELQQRWLDAIAGTALQIPALGVNALCGDGMSKADKMATVRAILADGVAIASAMEIPALQLPSFFDGAIGTDQELATTAECLQEVCDLAEAHGIVVCTENALTVEDCLKLIALVDRQNLKVFFDTQNPWAMERQNAREILQSEYAHLYSAAHTKDGHGDKLSSALLGDGDSDFAQTMAVFVEQNYAGWFILENNYHSIADATDWQANVRKDITRIENLLAM